MRASATVNGRTKHLSGAERIVTPDELNHTVDSMVSRAQQHSPSDVQITLESVPYSSCRFTPCLPIRTVVTQSSQEAIRFARLLLHSAGVSCRVTEEAFTALSAGLGPGGTVLRGASIWCLTTGSRLEPDQERGVRASRFDYSPAGRQSIEAELKRFDLTHFRTREAVAVATKTLWSGVAAEVCWSDDPAYTTGYVATNRDGYVRLPEFKPDGCAGGRIFFFDRDCGDLSESLNRLEREFLLIQPPLRIESPVDAAEYCSI